MRSEYCCVQLGQRHSCARQLSGRNSVLKAVVFLGEAIILGEAVKFFSLHSTFGSFDNAKKRIYEALFFIRQLKFSFVSSVRN